MDGVTGQAGHPFVRVRAVLQHQAVQQRLTPHSRVPAQVDQGTEDEEDRQGAQPRLLHTVRARGGPGRGARDIVSARSGRRDRVALRGAGRVVAALAGAALAGAALAGAALAGAALVVAALAGAALVVAALAVAAL